ncbi:MAG: EutN/CcmL family microcompartment protein [Planctomycetota bacterium]
MQLGRVVGSVWATRKEETLEGLKMLLVQELGADMAPKDRVVVAIDAVGAGVGEVVLTAAGSSARQTESTKNRPVDAVIMAVVDSFDINGKVVFQKFEG